MQVLLNRSGRTISVKLYSRYDRDKRRSIVRRIGSIALEGPTAGVIPPTLTEQLTTAQQVVLHSKVAKVVAQRTADAQQRTLRGAVQSVQELADAVEAGLVVDNDSATSIRAAVDRALGGAAAPDSHTKAQRNPGRVILEAINALVDALLAGEAIDASAKEELEMGIELVLELLRGRRTDGSGL